MMHVLRNALALGFCGLILAALSGCDSKKPSVVTVTGVVTLDGKPVDRASVMLMHVSQGARPATGVTDAGGRFTAKTANVGEGVIPGTYMITVTKVETSGVMATAPACPARWPRPASRSGTCCRHAIPSPERRDSRPRWPRE